MIQENNYVQANKSSNQEDENHIQQPVQKEENIIESFMNTIQEAIQEPITMMEEAFRGQAKTKAGQRARSWWAIMLYVIAAILVLWFFGYNLSINGWKLPWNWTKIEPFTSIYSMISSMRTPPATTGATNVTTTPVTNAPNATTGATNVTTTPVTNAPNATTGTGDPATTGQNAGFSINDISVTTAHM